VKLTSTSEISTATFWGRRRHHCDRKKTQCKGKENYLPVEDSSQCQRQFGGTRKRNDKLRLESLFT
jgi:hypothetical protein